MAPCATLTDAIYSWWVHPLVVNDGQSGVTWVGEVDSAGANHIHRVTCSTGQVDSVTLAGPGEIDDHNGVAIAFSQSHPHLVVAYSRHNTDQHVRVQTVDRITLATGSQQTLGFTGDVTYAQFLQFGERIVLLCRAGASRWAYRISEDFGETWGPEQELIAASRIYVAARPDPLNLQTVHIGFSGHPIDSTYHNVGYCQLDLSSGNLTSGVTGNVLGNVNTVGGPELTEADIDQAVVVVGDEITRLLDVGVAADGVPALAYAIWDAPLGPPIYRVVTLQAGAWTQDVWTLASGEPFGFIAEARYLGGMALGREGAIGTLRTSRQSGGQWIVERWTRSGVDDWVLVAEEDRSTTRLIRPYSAYLAGPVQWAVQRVGHYNFYNDYLGNIEVYAPPATSSTPAGGLPVNAKAVIRTVVTWLACDLVTGRKIVELPNIQADVKRVLNTYESADLRLPVPRAGLGALDYELVERATSPRGGRNMLVLVVNDVPSWAGWIRNRRRGTLTEWVMPCVTLEAYLRARRVRDHTWVQQDVGSVIAAGLAADAGDLVGVGSGIGLIIDAPPAGILQDRTYVGTDRRTVFDALRELAAAGLIEWTVDLDWEDPAKRQVVQKILRIRVRIGTAAVRPKARFATNSDAQATYSLREDHGEGFYGNYFVAFGAGEGEDQIASEPAIDQSALDSGAPIVEVHWRPPGEAAEQTVLDQHAQTRLERSRQGTSTWEIAARWDQFPRLNVDWTIGDDIGADLVGAGHPLGVSVKGRAIGWELSIRAGKVRPILLDPLSDPGAL